MTSSGGVPAKTRIGSRADAEGYVAMVCFKHGPPRLHGVELEWTVHHAHDPRRSLDAGQLGSALGVHAPTTLVPDSPQLPLGRGSLVTVEPGGQVELSAPASPSVPALIDGLAADAAELTALLLAAGLVPGDSGLDAHRSPRRILTVPRYAAMEHAFRRLGPHGARMMCSTAGVQICLDAGERDETALRWRALHDLGPALVALFANSPRRAGADTGWVSGRTEATFGTCAPFTEPPPLEHDPASAWARMAMEAPVLCLRRGDNWIAPEGLTFGAWAEGALPGDRPTYDDLDYHLSTLFPPVRPRGYLEVRYLDAQPGDGWVVPTLLLTALMSTPSLIDKALAAAEPAAGRWFPAARGGLGDPLVRQAASSLVELGVAELGRTGASPELVASAAARLEQLADGGSPSRHSQSTLGRRAS